ncbi:hypothetical protein VF14_25550 [Nostoc linckia z18]|jgi:membrane protein required for beta-lactamase induction|uniref:Uncharacterized protein n=2 Tax=Nostoc linckia TaxID=92942 RepID=A0A9Q5Z7K1_NOSLI|nr:hypothetical protein VF02_34195 [Nostoc linckia z1]PHJ58677.1 hypothetical protein VF05_33590 [Nostoc linckia z3]PHJ59789.1 hypothetical protein VF03_34250 [Nostoc linckia z2]PHJ79783.1 hypothetical protein VF07_33285 [Nostoc linckia z6]PHJ81714.1 hypothetical protein VF06_18865 [Nostoc linckia z4]PHJ93455.1 hypothetical protein VF04_25850 [Nostoc linckia z7]PHJ97784.1 hypothetical protein VF08_28125 [Nostoc linckia z8]PHK06413.1 hypothetical protein VF09_25270 [Nostoc linckia z9]PHK1660
MWFVRFFRYKPIFVLKTYERRQSTLKNFPKILNFQWESIFSLTALEYLKSIKKQLLANNFQFFLLSFYWIASWVSILANI